MNKLNQPLPVDDVDLFQLIPARVLAAVARGELDLNYLAREELALRGLGLSGARIGLEPARAQLTVTHH